MGPITSMSTVIFVLLSVAQSVPILKEHQELMVPQTVGHTELNLPSEGLHEADHEFATSYQSFHLESKNPVPLIIKKKFCLQWATNLITTGCKHFSIATTLDC